MKKHILILGITTLCIFTIYMYIKLESDFKAKYQSIYKINQSYPLEITWFQYFFSNNKFNLSDNISDMIPENFSKNQTTKEFAQKIYSDEFNNNKKQLIFIPLFNRKTKRKESFVLISVGIDGKQNTEFTPGDTIYDDEYKTRFKFYNLKEYEQRKSMKFNLWDYLFGNKDYLVRYFDCIKEGHMGPVTLEKLNYQLHPPVKNQSISIIGSYTKDSISGDKNVIELTSWVDSYKALCQMNEPIDSSFTAGDTIMISGYLDHIDTNRNFHLTHCAFYQYARQTKPESIKSFSELNSREIENRKKILSN